LIATALEEERIFRELRDRWSPEATDLLEAVEAGRSASAHVLDSVKDEISQLQERASPASREAISSFSDAFISLNSSWDSLHDAYDELRARQPTLNSAEVGVSLSDLVIQLGGVAQQARSLPSASVTRPVAQALVEGIEHEEIALRKLRGTFARTAGVSGEPSGTESVQAFEEYDNALLFSSVGRSEAADRLAGIVKGASEESGQELAEFITSYQELVDAWIELEEGYGTWRRTEGGCNRGVITEALGQFTIRFGDLAREVRSLPRLELLEPLGEVLVEAAEGEEQALRRLRSNWRPFDAAIYESFEQERSAAGQLRRQVATGLNQLLTQHDIPPSELTR